MVDLRNVGNESSIFKPTPSIKNYRFGSGQLNVIN